MAGQNDFLIFDENRKNLLSQEVYVNDQARTDGFKKGLARSNVNNKVLYQTSKMCHALGELIADNGDNASDESSVDELKQNLKDMFVSFGGENGHAMFDIVLKDHTLDFYESKGLALLGSYVYKTAIAGSRFGYPSFFNKCIEEQAQGEITEVTLGENTVTMRIHSNGHQFYDISDKEKIDVFYNAMGFAWFYGVDTTNERILLPRNDWFEQITTNTAEVGMSVEAGIPNIIGTVSSGSYNPTTSGAFYETGTKKASSPNTGGSTMICGFDASLCSSVYGKSDTVQPKSVKKLAYMVVGNTEVESSITDFIDVTTTENDTIPLFTGLYLDFSPNNPSWLKAGLQQNASGIYQTCYNELVNVLNGETKYGNLKVINEADIVSGVDYSEYWKVNQEQMYFITPTKLSYGAYLDVAPARGNGIAIGLTDGTVSGMMCRIQDSTNYNAQAQLAVDSTGVLGSEIGGSGTVGRISTGTTLFGLVKDETVSGIETHLKSSSAQLYFKVANAVQSLEILDAGLVLEELSNKVDINSDVIDGQWIGKRQELGMSAGTHKRTTIDLSNYLPNDGNDYLVKFKLYGNDNDSTYGYYLETDKWITSETIDTTVNFKIDHIIGSANSRQNVVVIDLPVGGERYVQLTGSGADEIDLYALGYKRLGTNL